MRSKTKQQSGVAICIHDHNMNTGWSGHIAAGHELGALVLLPRMRPDHVEGNMQATLNRVLPTCHMICMSKAVVHLPKVLC